ncbi:BrnA antitoxin family protein [Candidatus Acetothermia bacterium]|nr:BrnA antitoxin family protein [Candidatus Acetothermia bacterium]MCI2437243.1 BrnA antitoxin family protein [Candidatus Acetothermia bacterium]
MAKMKIPKFKSYKEEAAWWDTHDVTEIEGLEVTKGETFIRPKKQIVSIRLERQFVDLLKYIAQEKGLGHTTLVRLWVIEKLKEHSQADR